MADERERERGGGGGGGEVTWKQNMLVRKRKETAIPPNPYSIRVLRPANSMMNTFRKKETLQAFR